MINYKNQDLIEFGFMINQYRKQELESAVEKFCEFFKNPEKPKFNGLSSFENLTNDEEVFTKGLIENRLNTRFEPGKWFSDGFNDPAKINIILFFVSPPPFFSTDLNVVVDGRTVFSSIVNYSMKTGDKKEFIYWIQKLYKKGYKSKSQDFDFLKISFDKLKNDYQCLIWSLARFAFKLNDFEKIKLAFDHHMTLLTVASFKLRRPFGINFHNLLGVANNALQHYRSHIELILHAMEVYDVAYDIEKRDHKNTFKQRLEDYYETMPPQDPDLGEVVFELFPELNEIPIS